MFRLTGTSLLQLILILEAINNTNAFILQHSGNLNSRFVCGSGKKSHFYPSHCNSIFSDRHSITLNSVESPESEDDKAFTSLENERSADIDRIRFRLNEMRRDLLAAELRAIEAEEKVDTIEKAAELGDERKLAMLQKKFEEKINELKEKANFFKSAFEKLEIDSEKAIKNVTDEADKYEKELKVEISSLIVSRDEESSKAFQYETKNLQLSSKVKETTFSLEAAMDAVRVEKDKVTDMKRQLTLLEIRFNTESSKFREDARNEKEELIREILQAKDDIWDQKRMSSEKMKEMDLVREKIIAEYEEERASVRNMMKQSFRLIKKRIVSVVKR